ncbi:peptide/nickel transport system permease protein [Kibdelosporangium banguiense]|uniref:Peptide/nickel transport system permease protein n=1 Tax=Kibdelosporangium banguiense TaxID=1365924 RepID=A0ABS4TS36_9PSEU|nr:ABC transporter permease [Kibdelosporangium banguiense]MBP2327208.1 peptide/nickel transport system permease protein [Kibdelosporangium banguiense]
MSRFLLARLVRLVAKMFICSGVVFASLYVAPGGPLAAITRGRLLTPEAQDELIRLYHLNDPFLDRFLSWLGNALLGDLGTSYVARQPVIDMIGPRLMVTVSLVLYAGLIIVLAGVGLGVLAAVRGGRVDGAIVAGFSALAAIPGFVASAVLLAVFAVGLGLFPSFGAGTGFLDRVWHLTLPAVALAVAAVGYVGRVTRTAVIAEKSREHVTTAVSRGMRPREVLVSHVLRNALVPITTSVGLTIAGLIASSVVVENVFSLDGVGSLLIESVNNKDFPVVQGVSLVLVASFVVVNTVVDLLYPVLDPRIRRGALL